MDVKSTWISTWHLHGSCFMVTSIIFKNHLWEVGLTQNRETMALRTLTTVGLFYFIMCEDLHEYKFIEIAFGWEPATYDFTLLLRVRDHVTWFWRCVGTTFGHFHLCSHDHMVMALGSCVKWPLHTLTTLDIVFSVADFIWLAQCKM